MFKSGLRRLVQGLGVLLLAAGLILPVQAEEMQVAQADVQLAHVEGTLLDTHTRAIGEVPSIDEEEATRVALAALGRQIPNMELLDRHGKPVRLSRYEGKPLLVSFIYTGCFEICPTQTRTLYEAVKGLDNLLGENQFNVISIGFNQPFDDPNAMRSFAAQHRIKHRNWEFLSPTVQQVEELARAFGFSYVATPAGFDHVLGVTVVDGKGKIHTQVLGDRMSADRLGSPMRQLLLWDQDKPAEELSGLASVVERVRILCTVYDAKTGEYRYDYKLVLEILSGALFFLSVLVYGIIELLRQHRRRKALRASRSPTCPASPATAQPVSGSMA